MKNLELELKQKIKMLEATLSEKETEIKQLASVANYDFLTLLYNRHGFINEMEKVFAEIQGRRRDTENRKIIFDDFSLIFIDIDDLKKINDECGHDGGDKALKKAASLFQALVRKFDIVARWGGDEFVVGLLGADLEMASKIAENMRKELQKLKVCDKKLSASFGVADISRYCSAERKICDIGELIKKADQSMYEAKQQKGKNAVVVCDEAVYKD